MSSICITLDVDWAPEPVIADVVGLLDAHEIKATFFATGSSEVLRSATLRGHEISLHPNYKDGTSPKSTLAQLKQLWPAARGVRAHGLKSSSALLKMYLDEGLEYNCDAFVPDQEILRPFLRLTKTRLVCLPFCWEDDTHFKSGLPFETDCLRLDREGLLIYNFHPIHIYLNTDSDLTYRSVRSDYQDPESLLKKRVKGKGTRTLFLDLLDWLSRNREQVTTTGLVAAKFRREKGLT